MKKVTLRADADLIGQARAVARAHHKTLNAAFREWLQQYAAQSGSAQEVDSLMERLKHVRAGRNFTREEINEQPVVSFLSSADWQRKVKDSAQGEGACAESDLSR